MKSINEVFNDTEFDKLRQVKGDRTWRTAIKDEFGITDTDDR